MAIEGPFLSAVIARMEDPKYNLAAYGVAFAIALIVEAPVIMLMSGVVALLKEPQAYRKLWIFSRNLSFIVTAILGISLIPPIFDFIMYDLLHLVPEVAHRTYWALVFLLPWPLVIGIRRFYQGILIRNGQTRKVAYGTGFRLLAMSGTALLFGWLGVLQGAETGAFALSVGVTVEMVVVYFMTRKLLLRYTNVPDTSGITYREIIRFYIPLALTSVITLMVTPLLTFFMGRAPLPIESLAVYPVVGALVFIFRSMGISYQEVVIALLDPNFRTYQPLLRFCIGIALIAVVLLFIISFTPLGIFWYAIISGLPEDLTHYAIQATKILAVIPGLTAWLAFQRGVLITKGDTGAVSAATVIELLLVGATMWFLIAQYGLIGIYAAAAALVLGRLGANAYLQWKLLSVTRALNTAAAGISSGKQ